MIQKLLVSGYSLQSINDLNSLFQTNLLSAKLTFAQGEIKETLSCLHKLKGGLNVLQLHKYTSTIEALEKSIKLDGVEQSEEQLKGLIKELFALSTNMQSQLFQLIQIENKV